ncbi:MAG: DUF72 domain-containing protein [Roseiflexaceae bacterium]|nr:DUF72 domain-containing protein [Roseiflexaceae bacterium]
MTKINRSFYLGCAVWAYKDWVGTLFPPGSKSAEFLRLYSRRLTTVEGNTTFYAVPKPEVVRRWAEETPESFRFCFKLPREISHSGHLRRKIDATLAFVDLLRPLGPRLGPFFLQLPPGFAPDQLGDLAAWLEAWPLGQRIAVEVRHDDWFLPPHEQALQQLLETHGAGRVLMDVRPLDLGPLPGAEQDLQRARDNKPSVPLHPLHSGGFAFVRFISHPDLPLNGPLLDEWAARTAQWLAEGVETYVFMHCPLEARSPLVARDFQQRLERATSVPALPWNTLDGQDGVQQLSLF